jgi:hypothetical protein
VFVGKSGQSVQIFDVRNSASDVLFAVGANGQIRTNQTSANTNSPSGATAYKLPIYDAAGSLLGYVPVYGSAW